jgi:hypothetical protein
MQPVQPHWEDGLTGLSRTLVCATPNTLILVHIVKSQGILNITIAVAPKPSFLLNERIYTKLSLERDQLWAIRCLEAAAVRAIGEMENAWSIAAIFFVVSPKLPRTTRSAAKNMIERVILAMTPETRTQGAEVVVSGIEEWLAQVGRMLNSAES